MGDAPCNQPMTPNSKLGSQSSVTPVYQSPSWACLPFTHVGVHEGHTLRKQFASALQQNPNWLLIYGWNEAIAQARATEAGSPLAMGFETDPTISNHGFGDLYAVEYTRDIEPTTQYGTMLYDISKSCVSMYHRGDLSCDDPSELCCQGGAVSENYVFYDGHGGMFEMYTPNHVGSGTRTLYQCMQGTNPVLSTDGSCGGSGPKATVLGNIGVQRGGYFLRPLYRCVNSNGVYSYSATGSCGSSRFYAMLGYVR